MTRFEEFVSNLRNWAFTSSGDNESNEKLLATTQSSAPPLTLDSETDFSERWPRSRIFHRILFISGLLATIVLGTVILFALNKDSDSGVVPNSPPPPSQGGTTVIAHCGISPQEAIERGCIWDIMSFGWIHPSCFDEEESNRWKEKYGPFEWYVKDDQPVDEKDQPLNGTLTKPLTLDEIPFTPEVYTTQGYHIMHCLYLLKMVHVAALNDAPVSNEAVDLGHTDHCVGLIGKGNSDLIEYDVITTGVRLLYVQCVTMT